MPDRRFFERYFDELARRLQDASAEQLDALCAVLVDAGARGRKIVLGGNGASAGIASHVAVDLTKVSGIRAVNFNEADLITCFANDYGYEQWLARAIAAYGDPGDVAVIVSDTFAASCLRVTGHPWSSAHSAPAVRSRQAHAEAQPCPAGYGLTAPAGAP